MRMLLNRLFSICVLCAASGALFVACGPEEEGAIPCETDEDCGEGVACEEEWCLVECDSEADCGPDHDCVQGTTTDEMICKEVE